MFTGVQISCSLLLFTFYEKESKKCVTNFDALLSTVTTESESVQTWKIEYQLNLTSLISYIQHTQTYLQHIKKAVIAVVNVNIDHLPYKNRIPLLQKFCTSNNSVTYKSLSKKKVTVVIILLCKIRARGPQVKQGSSACTALLQQIDLYFKLKVSSSLCFPLLLRQTFP